MHPHTLRAAPVLDAPRRTRVAVADRRGGALVLVDDENVRLVGALDLGGREPDYAVLRDEVRAAFARCELHVFAARPARQVLAGAGIRVHEKRATGKNADLEAALFYARRTADWSPAHLLLVSGDHDWEALLLDARARGIRCGFVVPPGPACSRRLQAHRVGHLGWDLFRRRTRSPR